MLTSPHRKNSNIILIGPSGSGKSSFGHFLLDRFSGFMMCNTEWCFAGFLPEHLLIFWDQFDFPKEKPKRSELKKILDGKMYNLRIKNHERIKFHPVVNIFAITIDSTEMSLEEFHEFNNRAVVYFIPSTYENSDFVYCTN